MSGWLERAWYNSAQPLALLSGLEWLFKRLAGKRRNRYLTHPEKAYRAPVPVVVVGNISVGGTGKTPFTLWLLELLKAQGYSPGVISRGYGGKAPNYPFDVTPDCSAAQVGDEPLMLVQRSGCPLVVDPVRGRAAERLLALHDCDIIISDDGLQHYALQRDIEIAVVDGKRGLGNGRCLPVGPLREPPQRLGEVDFVVVNGTVGSFVYPNGFSMTLQPGALKRLDDSEASLIPQQVHAVAGIGNPQRFFDTLSQLGYGVIPHPFPDHREYRLQDLEFDDDLPVLMTEKDAVKCRAFAQHNRYYLPVNAQLSSLLGDQIIDRINALVATFKDLRKNDG
ncbi:MAG: tetraacyldisaccharide 4'-kinase [Halopseudomonas sp.]